MCSARPRGQRNGGRTGPVTLEPARGSKVTGRADVPPACSGVSFGTADSGARGCVPLALNTSFLNTLNE